MNKNKTCILHISDLHRSRENPLSNTALLNSLLIDIDGYNDLGIPMPNLLIVSGDIIQGTNETTNAESIIREQYKEALFFLNELTDKLFKGDKKKVIIVPGNHDVNRSESISSMVKVEEHHLVDTEGYLKKDVLQKVFVLNPQFKWSWKDRAFYKITDFDLYNGRLKYFSDFFNEFYENKYVFELDPKLQFTIFDFPELGVSALGLNSNYHNDHLNRAGAIHPECIAKAGMELRKLKSKGRFLISTWHHNTTGGPYDQDYMDNTFLKNLIAQDIKVCFHGHQHRNEVLRAESNIVEDKVMLVISAGSLCAGIKELPTGYSRQYNAVVLERTDDEKVQLTIHSRLKSLESSFDNPIWCTGTIDSSGINKFSKEIKHQRPPIPSLGDAEKLLGKKDFINAINILEQHGVEDDFARKLLLECLSQTENHEKIISYFNEPRTNEEAVLLMSAFIELNDKVGGKKAISKPIIANSMDASVLHLRNQLK